MPLLYDVGLSAANCVGYAITIAISIPILLWELVASFMWPPVTTPAREPNCILITGATSGIGEALALRYSRPGVTLCLTGRNETALKDVTSRCSALGATVHSHRGDVTDKEGLGRWIAQRDAAVPIDLVYANAGVTESTTATWNDFEAAARTIFATNVDGVFNTIFPIIPRMQARGRGQIVLLSSQAGFGALTRSAAYSASKAAVRVYGNALRAELAAYGIRVNVVCPGYVKSPMTDANRFPQPFKVSMSYAIDVITRGIAADVPLISFPAVTYMAAWLLGTLPPLVRDFFARHRVLPQIAYARRHRAEAAGAAGAAPAGAAGSAGKKSADAQ